MSSAHDEGMLMQVSLVINYDLPNSRELYIHRIGRSGRFGRKGVAINFVREDDIRILRDIEQFYSTQIDEMVSAICSGTVPIMFVSEGAQLILQSICSYTSSEPAFLLCLKVGLSRTCKIMCMCHRGFTASSAHLRYTASFQYLYNDSCSRVALGFGLSQGAQGMIITVH